MTKHYWLSCNLFTVYVGVTDGVVTQTAKVVWKFQGQRFDNLIRWAKRFGGFQLVELSQ